MLLGLTLAVGASGCGGAGEPSGAPTAPAPAVTVTPGPDATRSHPPEPATPSPAPSPSASAAPAPTTPPSPTPTTPPTTPGPPPPPPPSACTAPAALRGVDWERIPTTSKVVALTFDGGSSDAGVASILATLRVEGVPATFFVTGDFARRYPAQVAAMSAAGHRMGNHSDHHDHYPELTNAEIAADLAAAEAAITATGARAACPLFRFPFGDRTTADVAAVNDAGYVPVRWTVDSLGWTGTSRMTVQAVVDRVLDAATPGAIVLLHVGAHPDDGTTFDADALPAIIAGFRARGYSFVTLDRLLG
ncbi:MAG: polysaccharide deacetylase family protein [Actinotalea sp.]|nr:polysaccharide deacetylase family protein [Actinotalea sp.]